MHEVAPERTDGERGAVAAPSGAVPLVLGHGGERRRQRLGRRRAARRPRRPGPARRTARRPPSRPGPSWRTAGRPRRASAADGRSNRRNTSRTWQPYSRGDHTPGRGRRRTSGRASTSCHDAAFPRTSSGMSCTSIDGASKPHSGHPRSRTHVQSLSSRGTASSSIGGPYGPRRTGMHGVSPMSARRPLGHDYPRPEGSTTGTEGGPYRSFPPGRIELSGRTGGCGRREPVGRAGGAIDPAEQRPGVRAAPRSFRVSSSTLEPATGPRRRRAMIR